MQRSFIFLFTLSFLKGHSKCEIYIFYYLFIHVASVSLKRLLFLQEQYFRQVKFVDYGPYIRKEILMTATGLEPTTTWFVNEHSLRTKWSWIRVQLQ